MTAFIIILVLVIVAALLFFVIHSKRAAQRAEAWDGVITEKTRSSPDGQNMYNYVVVQLADGQTKKVHIHGKLYKTLLVGDKLTKQAGKYNPDKL